MQRVLAAVAVAALLSSGSAGFFAPPDQPHACTGHACYCRPAAKSAPAPAAEAPCHGTSSPRATTTLQSTCDHQEGGFTVVAPVHEALLPSSPVIRIDAGQPLPEAVAPRPWLRAARPETPPPRPASC